MVVRSTGPRQVKQEFVVAFDGCKNRLNCYASKLEADYDALAGPSIRIATGVYGNLAGAT